MEVFVMTMTVALDAALDETDANSEDSDDVREC